VPDRYIVDLVPNVYCGGRLADINYSKLNDYDIDVIRNLAKHRSFNKFSLKFEYGTLDIRDATDENLFEKLVVVFERMEYNLKLGKRLFVHCSKRISRASELLSLF